MINRRPARRCDVLPHGRWWRQSNALSLVALIVICSISDVSSADHDRQSWRRGALAFGEYCSGCHSLRYLRRQQIVDDLQLDRQAVDALGFGGEGRSMTSPWQPAMTGDQGQRWFGVAPPDLSLTARVNGAQWIDDYLSSYYPDPHQPTGWNNRIRPGTAMPNPLWELQFARCQRTFGTAWPPSPWCQASPSNPEFDQTVADITAFLAYAAEPAIVPRQHWRGWVIAVLVLFTVLCALLKREFWEDVRS